MQRHVIPCRHLVIDAIPIGREVNRLSKLTPLRHPILIPSMRSRPGAAWSSYDAAVPGQRGLGLVLCSVFEAPAFVSSFHDFAMVRQAVEERGGHLCVPEDAGPFAENQVGGDDDRNAFIVLPSIPKNRSHHQTMGSNIWSGRSSANRTRVLRRAKTIGVPKQYLKTAIHASNRGRSSPHSAGRVSNRTSCRTGRTRSAGNVRAIAAFSTWSLVGLRRFHAALNCNSCAVQKQRFRYLPGQFRLDTYKSRAPRSLWHLHPCKPV